MIILGIDPGIAITGIGVIEKKANGLVVPLFYDQITTPAHTPLSERLSIIYDSVTKIVEKFNPNVMSIEELFFNNNAKTAFAVGQARGVIILAAKQHNIDIFEYTPLQVKQSVTGYGRADKKQIQHMVKIMLGLSTVPKPDDVADALAVAICHSNSERFLSITEAKL